MLFNRIEFLIFLPLVLAAVRLAAPRWHWAVLLTASYFFYGWWKAEYLVLILISTTVDYVAARRIAENEASGVRRRWLFFSVATNLGILVAFKYLAFFGRGAELLLGAFGVGFEVPDTGWALPVGISFYTFQTMSYTIDVYRGAIPVRHPGLFALYVAFFPQLVAGPIERAGHLVPQLRGGVRFASGQVREGLDRMLWGLFKKAVIADRISLIVTPVYLSPENHSPAAVVLATVLFAFQLYCDFSGYSDIAIGCARIMGIELTENFRTPYFSRTIREFWRRWHVTLSSWLRDYVYIPLGGNRQGRVHTVINLFITAYLAGLWHGAGANFLAFGALHGVYLITGRAMAPFRDRIRQRAGRADPLLATFETLLTFGLWCLSLVFFRAGELGRAFQLLARVELGLADPATFMADLGGRLATAPIQILLALVFLLLVVWTLAPDERFEDLVARRSSGTRILIRVALVYGFIVLSPGANLPFIYFQF